LQLNLLKCHALLLALLITGGGSASTPSASYGTANQAGIRVLVDSIHAHNALRLPAGADPFAYHNVYGFRRVFDYLRSQGVKVDEVSTGRLDPEKLASYRMLFINLVSADLPPFRVSEILAIKRFVESGGSLLVITDHSNCYYHAYKLTPLLEELGIEGRTETACEQPPATLGDGNAWITISRFASHPVTKGLRTIAMQTAGTVDDRYAVAKISDRSWGDQWQHHPYGEDDSQSFYGNWRKDRGERSGPLGVVLARNFALGRIVIVADQNMFGDPFINYADNYRLWLNSVAWLTGEPHLARVQPYEWWRAPRVMAYEKYSDAAFGNGGSGGYYSLFVWLGRRLWMFAGDDLSGKQDLILFAHDRYELSSEAMAAILKHLRSGRNIVILGQHPQPKNRRPGLVAQLKAKLGEPANVGDVMIPSYKWPNCGEVTVLSQNKVYQNDTMPTPEKEPDANQQLVLDALVQVLSEAVHNPASQFDAYQKMIP
jgi:hypothetical protein